jgi:hypothetical protein
MTRTTLTRVAIALCALTLSLPAAAQQGGWPGGQGGNGGWPNGQGGNGGGGFPGMPGQSEDLVNLGALGLGVNVSGTRLDVRELLEGSPAGRVGVQVGDAIVGVSGRPLQEAAPGPVLQVIAAVEKAEAARKKRVVVLTVSRGGQERQVTVPVGKLGKHSRSCPTKCKKCDKVVRQGLEFLVRTQSSDGSFPTSLGGKTGTVVVTSLSGLALLSAGLKPQPGSPLGKAIDYVLDHVGQADTGPLAGMGGGRGNWNQINWELGYGLMFLTEVARKTRRADVLEKCRELVRIIEVNQEASGGWAHGPGGPNALGYVELEIVGNYLLTGLGAARRLELELNEDKLSKALTWIEGTSPGDGGVGYSQRDGQRFGDAGRTAGALVAYNALGQSRAPFFEKMANYYVGHIEKLPEGHVSPAMHLLAGAMASRVLGKAATREYYERFRLHIMQHRRPNGSFASTPTEESQSMRNNTDLSVGPRWTTATYVLILTLHEGNLPLLLGEADKGGTSKRGSTRRSRPRTGA